YRLSREAIVAPVQVEGFSEAQRSKLRRRDIPQATSFFERTKRLIDALGRQLERAKMHPDAFSSPELDMGSNCLVWIHVYALHEPTRLVSADRQARKIHRPQLLTNLSKHWRVSRIAGEEYPDALDAHHESAPERPIPIERAARGEMMGRRQRNRAV